MRSCHQCGWYPGWPNDGDEKYAEVAVPAHEADAPRWCLTTEDHRIFGVQFTRRVLDPSSVTVTWETEPLSPRVIQGSNGWYIVRAGFWPLPPWDVYRVHMVGNQARFERFAGGFYLTRSAKAWAEKENRVYLS